MQNKMEKKRKELKVEIVRCHQILLNNSKVTSLWLFLALLLLCSLPMPMELRSVQRVKKRAQYSCLLLWFIYLIFLSYVFFSAPSTIFGHFALKYLPFTFYLLIIYHSLCFKFSFVVLLCHPFSCVDRLISFFSSFVVGREKNKKNNIYCVHCTYTGAVLYSVPLFLLWWWWFCYCYIVGFSLELIIVPTWEREINIGENILLHGASTKCTWIFY